MKLLKSLIQPQENFICASYCDGYESIQHEDSTLNDIIIFHRTRFGRSKYLRCVQYKLSHEVNTICFVVP